jgi:hypothetical protein
MGSMFLYHGDSQASRFVKRSGVAARFHRWPENSVGDRD